MRGTPKVNQRDQIQPPTLTVTVTGQQRIGLMAESSSTHLHRLLRVLKRKLIRLISSGQAIQQRLSLALLRGPPHADDGQKGRMTEGMHACPEQKLVLANALPTLADYSLHTYLARPTVYNKTVYLSSFTAD